MLEPDEISLDSRVGLVPLVVRRDGARALIGRTDGSDWIEADAVGAEVLEELDRGQTVGSVQARVSRATGQPVDVLSFARELAALGLAAPFDEHHAGTRVSPAAPDAGRSPWWSDLLVLASAVAAAYVAWSFGSGALVVPSGADLLIQGIPLAAAVAACGATAVGVLAAHEAAHVLVGRGYGLTLGVSPGRRAAWLVVQTDLSGVRALPRHQRWRPVAAGMMLDVALLGLSVVALRHPAPGIPVAMARMVAAVLVAQLTWQMQWYLRTDVYHLMCLIAGTANLRRAARLVLLSSIRRRSATAGPDRTVLATRELTVATVYALSLPLAVAATAALGWWILRPPLAQIIGAIAGG